MDHDAAEGEVLKTTARLLEDQLTSGTILKQTFSVFFSNIAAFGLITLLLMSPVILLQYYYVSQAAQGEMEIGQLLVLLLSIVLTPLATGALTYGVFQIVREREISVGDSLSVGLSRMFPVLGVAFLQGLAIVGGMILCIVPGFIVAAILAVSVPVAVIEKPGIFASLRRSADLTKEYRWTVFGAIFALMLLGAAAGLLTEVLRPMSQMLWFAGYVVQILLSTGLQATAGSLLYYHLRSKKEALDVEAIADVFA